ncbi:hypothetical protein [Actinomadura fibrosa]|uniref:Uncharacterized protein n=1 Tax=Actinomadura fibrosa TaxID=111802 RepID=A0ABW2Y5J0_9ACTN|nr:hypothetical protein [Actinomadura fibrosa]
MNNPLPPNGSDVPDDPAAADVPYPDVAPRPGYETSTRKPVVYLPVTLDGELIGYLWAGTTDRAAGFVRRLEAASQSLEASIVWHQRLDEAHGEGLPAREAIRRWVGEPEHPRAGGIPAGTPEQDAATLAELDTLANPHLPPEPGPLIQDGELPDGTPVDRSKGWGPLTLTVPPTYDTDAVGPVRYLPVTRNDVVLGYLWASVTGNAAAYLERPDTGLVGADAGGALIPRLREAYEAGLSPLEAIRRLKGGEEGVSAMAEEREVPALDDLRRLASEYTQSLRLTFPSVRPDGAPADPRPPVPPEERDAIVRYLDEAPVVHDNGESAPDVLDPSSTATVPDRYHTDGTWVWPGDVPYYLQNHDMPPEPAFVEHIRGNGFQVPAIGDDDRAAALRTLEWNGILVPPPGW